MNKNQVGLRNLHPFSALLFLIFAFVVSMASTHPLLLAANLTAAIAADIAVQPKKAFRLMFRVLLPMLILITAFNGVYNHYGVTVLFETANGNRFTLEALLYGLVFAVKACTAVLWLDSLGEVFQSDKVIFLFGRLSPRLALVVSMVLRFLPLIRRQADEINASQRGLGVDVGTNVVQKLRAAAHRLSILISWTLERGIDTSDSMRARGYGLRPRSFYNRYAVSPTDMLFAGMTAAAIVLYFIVKKDFLSIYNPVVTIPFPSVFGWIVYCFILFSLFLPVWIELSSLRSMNKQKMK